MPLSKALVLGRRPLRLDIAIVVLLWGLGVVASALSSSILASQGRHRPRIPRHYRHHHHHHRHLHTKPKTHSVARTRSAAPISSPKSNSNAVKIPPVLVKVGERVLVHNILLGTVMFIGKTKFAKGTWIGIAIDEAKGKNDGSVKGHRYFQCEKKHGLFTKPENVIRYSQGKPVALSSTSKSKKDKGVDLLSITGKGGQEVPIQNLKDLKTKYLQDLDQKMYSLMHSSVSTKKTAAKDSFDDAVNTAVMKERKSMLDAQAAKVQAKNGNKISASKEGGNDPAAPGRLEGVAKPLFSGQQLAYPSSSVPQALSQVPNPPTLPALYPQELQAPLPGIFLQISSSQTSLKYDKYLDNTNVNLATIKKNNMAKYTLKDLEASGMNKVFDGVDTSGLPDQLVHPSLSHDTKGGRPPEVGNKNIGHLNDLDDVFVRMLDHNSHGKDILFTKSDIKTVHHVDPSGDY